MDSYSLEDAKNDAKTEAMIAARNQTYSIHSNNVVTQQAKELMLTGRVLAFAKCVMGTMAHSESSEEGSGEEREEGVQREQTETDAKGRDATLVTSIVSLLELLPKKIESTESSEFESCKSNSRDSTLKQLKRDVERDVICVNGVKMLGRNGMSFILEEMSTAIDRAWVSCNKHPSCLSSRKKKDFSILCLQKIARTNSGGQSFSALQSLIDLSSILIVPQSSLATPLLVNIHLGTHDDVIGVKATIKTETIFQLKEINPENTSATISDISNTEANDDSKEGDQSTSNANCTITGDMYSNAKNKNELMLSVIYENFVFAPVEPKSFNFHTKGFGSYNNGYDEDGDDDDSTNDDKKDDLFSAYEIMSKRHIVVGRGLLKLKA